MARDFDVGAPKQDGADKSARQSNEAYAFPSTDSSQQQTGLSGGMGGGMGGMGGAGGAGGGMGGIGSLAGGLFDAAKKKKEEREATRVPGIGQEANVPGRIDSARDRKKESSGISGGEGALFSGGSDPIEAGPDYTYRKLRLHKEDEVNPYAQVRDAQVGMDPRMKTCIGLGVLVVLSLVLAIVIPPEWFSENTRGMGMSQWITEFQNRVRGFVSLATFQGADYSMNFITYRYLIVALAGAALGISGAVYQGALKNALASPSTLGVMTGCNVGRIVYAVVIATSGTAVGSMYASEMADVYASMGPLEYLWNVYGSALCSLLGGFIVVTFVLLVSTVAGHGRISNVVMVIAGQVVATVISTAVSLLQYYLSETDSALAETVKNLQVETFSLTFRGLDVVLVGVPILIGIIIIMTQRSKLNLLAFSNEEARSMGLRTERARWTMVFTCTALTGVVVAFCGSIGMVGFMVPHIVRRLVGPDFKYLIPASALTGAAFLVITYFATSLFSSSILSSFGVYTSIIGGVVFLVLALKQRGQTRGDWL